MVEVLFLEKECIISGGADGYLRFWSYSFLENADITDDARLVMEPIEEYLIGDGVQVAGRVVLLMVPNVVGAARFVE